VDIGESENDGYEGAILGHPGNSARATSIRRHGQALCVDIAGRDHLISEHRDVMLEAATTSFQIHLKAPAQFEFPHKPAAMDHERNPIGITKIVIENDDRSIYESRL